MVTYKRRKYLIDRRLQAKYALLTILLLLVYTFLFAAILFIPQILGLVASNTIDEQAKAARMLLNLHQSVWPSLGLVAVILSTTSIFVTHKIAGPVYRFRKVLSEVSAGNLEISIKLRKRDDLKDLAEDLNNVINELRTFVLTLQEDHATMAACIDEIEDKIRNNQITSETGNELIARLKSSKDKTANALMKYSG